MSNIDGRMASWSTNQDYQFARKAILMVLKEEKVSLSQARLLFKDILDEIEDENLIDVV